MRQLSNSFKAAAIFKKNDKDKRNSGKQRRVNQCARPSKGIHVQLGTDTVLALNKELGG